MPEPLYTIPGYAVGLPGNIDLTSRPRVRNPDGTISTVRSMSIGTDQGEVLIPTVIGDRVVSEQEAIDYYMKSGQHLGIFPDTKTADAYAKALHKQQEQFYKAGK